MKRIDGVAIEISDGRGRGLGERRLREEQEQRDGRKKERQESPVL
jgi:hypothetical protein